MVLLAVSVVGLAASLSETELASPSRGSLIDHLSAWVVSPADWW